MYLENYNNIVQIGTNGSYDESSHQAGQDKHRGDEDADVHAFSDLNTEQSKSIGIHARPVLSCLVLSCLVLRIL